MRRPVFLTPIILAIVISLAAGCGIDPVRDSVELDITQSKALELGSYAGVLPCADCEGIRYRLDLFEDHVFFLSIEYLGQAKSLFNDDIGTWSITADGSTLTLHGGRETPRLFRVVGHSVLEKLDPEGQEIVSDLNHQLQFSDGLPPVEPHVFMSGMYSYMADAALFSECTTGRRFAVALEADNINLEKAYLEIRTVPGEAILIDVEGHIAQRPAMEGDGTMENLIVDRFVGIRPAEVCSQTGVEQSGNVENRTAFGSSR